MLRPSVSRHIISYSIVSLCLGSILLARGATSQVQGTLPGFVRLQGTTPGTAQDGHANVTGTIKAGTLKADLAYVGETYGSFYGSGIGLINLSLGGLDTTGATVGQVPMYDGSTVVWSSISGGSFTLPYSGSVSLAGAAAFLVENTATTSGSRAAGLFGNGAGTGLYVENRNTGSGGYGIKALHNGNGSAIYSESVGGNGLLGANLTSGNFASIGTPSYAVDALSSVGSAIRSRATGSGSGVEGYASSSSFFGVLGQNLSSNNYGYLGGRDYGVYGQTADNFAIYGFATANGSGVGGQNTSTGSRGVLGDKNYGVTAFSNVTAAVFGNSGSAIGVWGRSQSANDAIFGENTASGTGVHGKGNVGVFGEAGAGYAVLGQSTSTANVAAIYGESQGFTGAGVYGFSPFRGVRGESPSGSGVYGHANSGSTAYGVEGRSDSTNGRGGLFVCYGAQGVGVAGYGDTSGNSVNTVGVYGQAWIGLYGTGTYGLKTDSYASISSPTGTGLACGVSGDLFVTGNKEFVIDHPFDPANYELRHYCTEGPVPMNAYSGNIKTDASGYAWIDLPDYFEAINKDFRYQLTVLDESGSAGFVQVRVSRKIAGNRFQIQTSQGRTEVSWRVEATRNDRYNQIYPAKDVVQKVGARAGNYFTPSLWGKAKSDGIDYVVPPAGPTSARGATGKK